VLLLSFFLLPLIAVIWLCWNKGRLGGLLWQVLWAPVTLLVLLGLHFLDVLQGHVIRTDISWLPSLDLNIALRLDGLAMLMALLVLGIGSLVLYYARYYLEGEVRIVRFYAVMLCFITAMLGIALSANVLLLWFCWELTSVMSFLLVGHWYDQPNARKGARLALTITGAGGLALLAGLLLLGHMAGSYELTAIMSQAGNIQQQSLYPLMLCLVLLGAFTKSAQFPFHFWLPNAMAAPTPVSALLHSATLVKAGIFLLALLYPVLAGTDLWFILVTLTGLATLVTGAYFALFQHDIKGLLAYSTISHLGLIVLLLGLDSPLAAVAALFHLINHAIFKASLFMAAGIIDHETDSRDMRKINGLWQFMPITATLAMVASAAMAGVPLLNGFISKEMFFTETLHQEVFGSLSFVIPVLATLAACFSVAYSARFIHDVFFNGQPVGLAKVPHEPPRELRIPMEVLVALCLAIGLFPAFMIGDLLQAASTVVLQGQVPFYSLALWHGFNIPLLMSILAMGAGLLLYVNRKHLFQFQAGFNQVSMLYQFDGMLKRVQQRAQLWQEHIEVRRYQVAAMWLLSVVLLVVLLPLQSLPSLKGERADLPFDAVQAFIVVVMLFFAIMTVLFQRRRLLALVLISVVGLMVCLTFVRFSAPDLALTQLSVEVVTVVLMMLALYFLPQRSVKQSSPGQVVRHTTVAAAIGAAVGCLTYAMLTRQTDSVAAYYLEHARTLGGGNNVVNVILVDFRGFDTFGEITVLAIAALAILTVLTGLPRFMTGADERGRRWHHEAHPLMLATVSQILLPLALVVTLYIFWRGHHLPGGGFIAGLVTATALILQYVAHGVDWVKQRFSIDYSHIIFSGLAIALLTGLGSWWFDASFLTSWTGPIPMPWGEDFEFATAMLFDLGVYLTVVGATLMMLANLGKITTKHRPYHQGE
jgi:multicomponent K+:H+ antiporter subunit A